jgi:hypothetical protein
VDGSFELRHRWGEFFAADPAMPERAIGYPEGVVRGMYEDAGCE